MAVTYTLVQRLLTIRCQGSYEVEALRAPWLDVVARSERGELELPIACVLDVRQSESVLHRSIGARWRLVTSAR